MNVAAQAPQPAPPPAAAGMSRGRALAYMLASTLLAMTQGSA
jgi:hypothetical protein